jgi:pimeloyl-ACP methyl ester carboxylesterase
VQHKSKSSGRVFVCLHGIGGAPVDWSGVTGRLARLGEVVCVDVPGGSLGSARESVLAELADRDLRCAVLVGHSRGGVVALMAAAQRPDLVDRLVLSGGYVPPSRADRSWIIGTGSWVKHRVRLANRFVRAGHLTARQADRPASLSQSFATVFEMASVGLRPGSFDALVAAVRCPVLAICGQRDSHVPASWVSAAARRYGWSLAIIPAGTHFAHLDHPDAWADAVEAWLPR